MQLSLLFKSSFPGITYHSLSAKRQLMQMPLVTLRLGKPSSGTSVTYVMEYFPNVNYCQFLHVLSRFHHCPTKQGFGMSKDELKEVLKLASSDKERECIRYTAFRASGLSSTAARKHFGLQNMTTRANTVESALEERRAIYQAIDKISNVKEKALLLSFGISVPDSSPISSDFDSDSESSETDSVASHTIAIEPLIKVLQDSKFNWFNLMDHLQDSGTYTESELECCFREVMSGLDNCDERRLLEQSHSAYQAQQEQDAPLLERELAAAEGDIVSESDEENPDDYIRLSLQSDKAKEVILKRITALRRRTSREKAKAIAKRNFLNRKTSKNVRGILKECPDIGQKIEEFVKDHSVGADAWCRTGVLTFDGNKQVKEKVTYERIRLHLQEIYHRNISYGTVVQLCCARNKRRLSAKRYKGVAQVTSRRARKGFELRYNPDNHWSSAFYRGLNRLQLTDGSDIMNLNRDDASGFRLDTLTTHRLYRTPVVKGNEILTTHTDYVKNYPSQLQTTSYNFTGSATTGELCAGVVKAAGMFDKSPAQHNADIEMLQERSELQPAFINGVSNKPKRVECIRVDGAADEGPSHVEVQFWWTRRHFEKPTHVTLVTARNSGASYLNRVELQNGCLAVAHANLFIPSNLNGSCFDPSTGKVDQGRFDANMTLATQIYIDRVNGAPCGSTNIHLYPGARSSETLKLRADVLTYTKGSKAQKLELQNHNPGRFQYIQKIWDIRLQHGISDLPPQYSFMLKCCYMPTCTHPVCRAGEGSVLNWFPGGPKITYMPLPIPDPDQPWGSTTCTKCTGRCCGHFLMPEMAEKATTPAMKPPSTIIKEVFIGLNGQAPSETFFENLAKQCLLPTEEVKIWVEHLSQVQRNRQRGAQKAAATRKQKKAAQKSLSVTAVLCAVCGEPYEEFTEDVQKWICCEKCDRWLHFNCAGIVTEPDTYICHKCS